LIRTLRPPALLRYRIGGLPVESLKLVYDDGGGRVIHDVGAVTAWSFE